MADDDVVQERKPHRLARCRQLLGCVDVFDAGRRVSARMVVDDDDASGHREQGSPQDFPWAQEHAVGRANEDRVPRDELAAGVKTRDTEDLAVPFGEIRKTQGDVFRARHGP